VNQHNIETQNSTALTTDSETDALRKAMQQEGGGGPLDGRYLKFVKGRWYIGDEEIEAGSRYIAHPKEYHEGWVKFQRNKVVERRIFKKSGGVKPPQREDLGDLDRNLWEKDDPWSYQRYLPLEGLVDGELLVFVTPSGGGHRAINRVVNAYLRRGTGELPIIELGGGHYDHEHHGPIEFPKLTIVGWHDLGSGAAPFTAPAGTVTIIRPGEEKDCVPKPAPALHDETDDEIPF
jgi:hypothetical protein